MLLSQLRISRIPGLPRLRPPWPDRSRFFTQRSQTLLYSRNFLRPQIPYLQPSGVHRGSSPLDRYALRALNTEARRAAKEAVFKVSRVFIYSGLLITFANLILWGMNIEFHERLQPTPSEWHFWTRYRLRKARDEIEAWSINGYINWVAAGSQFLDVIKRLEDQNIDGQGVLVQQDDAGANIQVAELGTAGLDISKKSWEWRQGYFEALMGAAQASENTDDMVRDVTRQLVFPASTIIGPSNPNRRPVGEKMESAPLEQNCEKVFLAPETFYMKILTGKGFTTRQKLAAALAYGNWLEYSGLNEAAYEVFRWGVDIAKQPLQDAENLLKPASFVIKTDNTVRASENLISAVTALGAHQARIGNVQTALPILLAAFKARKEAPLVHRAAPKIYNPTSQLDAMSLLFTSAPAMLEPTSGDEPYERSTESSCADSELMLYIGELMYASTTKKEEGCVWTKQAAEVAAREMQSLSSPVLSRAELKAENRKCRQCLRTGIKNWSFMLEDLATQQPSRPAATGWFGTKPTEKLSYDHDRPRLEELDAMALRYQWDTDSLSIRRSGKFGMFKG